METTAATNAANVISTKQHYDQNYALHLQHLLLKGMRLQVGDIDAARGRVHIRDAKGNRDRLVPLPNATHQVLRRFWQLHRNPVLLFPSRQGGVKRAARARTHLDPGGVQSALHKVVNACGLKKTSPRTVCATAMQPT